MATASVSSSRPSKSSWQQHTTTTWYYFSSGDLPNNDNDVNYAAWYNNVCRSNFRLVSGVEAKVVALFQCTSLYFKNTNQKLIT